MYLNHLLTPCKPPPYSNTTYHHKSNFQHHKYRVLQVFKSKKILFFTSNQQSHSHLQEMKNTHNMYLNHLLTLCKSPACSNITYYHKSNFQHHKYRVLQVIKSKKILFFISNQQYLFTFAINEKHSQYIFKPPYNITQVTRLLQHNNSPQLISNITSIEFYKY